MRLLLSLVLVFSMTACVSLDYDNSPHNDEPVPIEAQTPLADFLAKSSKPAIIKFYAEWCSTCKQYQPTYSKIKAQYGEQIDFFEVDVDNKEFKPLIKQLKISRIPETVFINKSRDSVIKKLGAIQETKLVEMMETHLS